LNADLHFHLCERCGHIWSHASEAAAGHQCSKCVSDERWLVRYETMRAAVEDRATIRKSTESRYRTGSMYAMPNAES
jgi:hypothetical protein